MVNISPPATDTDIWDDVPGEWPTDKMMSPDEVAEAVAFVYERPPGTVINDLELANIGGNL